MDGHASSLESTAPSRSPMPLRGGRRIAKIQENLLVYKLCATVILYLQTVVEAGFGIGAKEVQDIQGRFALLLGSKRVMDGSSEVPNKGNTHIAQWNAGLDRVFVDAMLEHETSWAGSTFTVPGWHSIVRRFNEVSCLSYTKAQLQHRWKNMKKDYSSYLYLRNKSGWGWDIIYNKPIPPSDEAWFELADRYRKYRNKPFLYYGDIQRFLSKDIATGVHATSSRQARDKQPMGPSSSRQAVRQRELNFDENLDECMSDPIEDAGGSDEMTPTPSSRKRSSVGRSSKSKKSRSGASMNASTHEILKTFLTALPKTFAEARHDPDQMTHVACREISMSRPDLTIDQFEMIAEKLATMSGRNVFYHVKDDPDKLNAWIERTIHP